MIKTDSRPRSRSPEAGFHGGLAERHADDADAAAIAAASRLGVAAALLSGVGLVLLALI